MRYCVKESCVGCGLCVATCPEGFFMNENGSAQAVDGPVEPAWEASAREAMENCPVGAIEEE